MEDSKGVIYDHNVFIESSVTIVTMLIILDTAFTISRVVNLQSEHVYSTDHRYRLITTLTHISLFY